MYEILNILFIMNSIEYNGLKLYKKVTVIEQFNKKHNIYYKIRQMKGVIPISIYN